MNNLNIILESAKELLSEGNFKMASVEVSKGIEVCSIHHKTLNEEVNPMWGMRDKWDYKQEYKVNGKRLQYWSEKFWTMLEDNNLDLVMRTPVNLEPLMTMMVQGVNSNGQREMTEVNM